MVYQFSLPLINSARCCPVFFFLLYLLLRGNIGGGGGGDEGVQRHGKGAEMQPRMFLKCSLTQLQPPASTNGNIKLETGPLAGLATSHTIQPHGEETLTGIWP